MKELFNSPYFGQFCVMVASIALMLSAMNLYWAMKKVVTLWGDLRESVYGKGYIPLPKGFVFTPLSGNDDFEDTVTDQRDTYEIKKDA